MPLQNNTPPDDAGIALTVAPLPTIIIDTREQTPLDFPHLPSRPGTLYTGDYSLAGFESVFAVERKSIQDLCSSLRAGRERFMHELHRLRAFQFRRLLIIGTPTEYSQLVAQGRANPKQVDHSLLSIAINYDIPSIARPSPQAAAALIESWAFSFYRSRAASFGAKVPYPDWATPQIL